VRLAVADAAERTLARGERLLADRRRIETAFGSAGIAATWLKGAWLAERIYDPPGSRPAADLDVLVRDPSQAVLAGAVLARLGYVQTERTWKHAVFAQPDNRAVVDWRGEHPDNPRPVEVHTWLGEAFRGIRFDLRAPLASIPSAGPGRIGLPGSASAPPGMTAFAVSSWTVLPNWLGLAHLAAHASVDALGRKLRLIQLIDLARLAPRLEAADWRAFEQCCATPPAARFVWPALALGVRELGSDGMPEGLLDRLAESVQPSLRAWVERLDVDTASRFGRMEARRALDEVPRIWPLDRRERWTVWRFVAWPARWELADRYPRLARSALWPLMYLRHLGYNAGVARRRWRQRT
jgi:hypothetical protein